MNDDKAPRCQYVEASEPLMYCGTPARWRYPAEGGGNMYICDEHAIPILNQVEAVPCDNDTT